MSKKSIVNFHYGQAGIQMGWEIWKLYCHEHGINGDGSRTLPEAECDHDNYKTFFYETAGGRYVPKCVFVDSEPSVIEALRNSSLGFLVHDECMISSRQGCRNMMGLSFFDNFSTSASVHSQTREALRRMNESCDRMSGYMHFLSACGGSGPGYCGKTLSDMQNLVPKAINHTYTLLPSPTISQNPMEIYNAMMFLGLIRFDNLAVNINTCFDNEALYRQSIQLSSTPRNKFTPSYKHINELIAVSISSATASIRWDGQLNVDLEDFQVNLVPYPTMHHLFHTSSPIYNNGNKERLRVVDLTLQAFRPEAHCISLNCLSDAMKWEEDEELETWNPPSFVEDAEEESKQRSDDQIKDYAYSLSHGLIGCCLMYRGDVMPVKVNKAIRVLKETYNPYFVSWVPNGFKVGINSPQLIHPKDWEYPDCRRSLLAIVNSTCMAEKFKHILSHYRQMREQESYNFWFDHGFNNEVMDQTKEGLVDLITQYEAAMGRRTDPEDMKEAMAVRPEKFDKNLKLGRASKKR